MRAVLSVHPLVTLLLQGGVQSFLVPVTNAFPERMEAGGIGLVKVERREVASTPKP